MKKAKYFNSYLDLLVFDRLLHVERVRLEGVLGGDAIALNFVIGLKEQTLCIIQYTRKLIIVPCTSPLPEPSDRCRPSTDDPCRW